MQDIVDRVVMLSKLKGWLEEKVDTTIICECCGEQLLYEINQLIEGEIYDDELSLRSYVLDY